MKLSGGKEIIDEFVIPRASSRAFLLEKGHHLKVIAHEGKQVADLRFLSADDHREEWSSWLSIALNRIAGTGGMRRLTHLYSKLPWNNLMATVTEDTVGHHQFYGNCNPAFYAAWGKEGHANCFDLFAECLQPHGIDMADLESASVFNLFMPVRYVDDEQGTYVFGPPTCDKGDSITFRAEMDLMVAATSCPEDTVVNEFDAKSMLYQIRGK